MKKAIKVLFMILLVLFLGSVGFIYLMETPHPLYHPQIYRTATSPDGTWSVEVWREAPPPYPYADGVDVIVVVKDAHGTVVKQETIDTRDRWEDVEDDYFEVIITNTEIRIGPNWVGYTKPSYYTIIKKDLRL